MKLSHEQREVATIISILVFVLFLGTFIFMHIEKWHFIDALYFTTATLTTVGFGDVVPLTYAGKIFGILYMWIGVTIAVYSIAYIGSHVIGRRVHQKSERGWRIWKRKEDSN